MDSLERPENILVSLNTEQSARYTSSMGTDLLPVPLMFINTLMIVYLLVLG